MPGGKFFGQGIPISTGFDLNSKRPLDLRTYVDSYDELANYDDSQLYEGLVVYVSKDTTNYQYVNGKWEIYGDSALNHFIVEDSFDSRSTKNAISVNKAAELNDGLTEVKNNKVDKAFGNTYKLITNAALFATENNGTKGVLRLQMPYTYSPVMISMEIIVFDNRQVACNKLYLSGTVTTNGWTNCNANAYVPFPYKIRFARKSNQVCILFNEIDGPYFEYTAMAVTKCLVSGSGVGTLTTNYTFSVDQDETSVDGVVEPELNKGTYAYTLQGKVPDDFAKRIHTHTIAQINGLETALSERVLNSDYTPEKILEMLKTVDGVGSGLDADLFQGHDASYFAKAGSTPGASGSADMLTHARKIELTGPITGETMFDGTEDVQIPVSIAGSVYLPGNPTTNTPDTFDESTKIATTAQVHAAIIARLAAADAMTYKGVLTPPTNLPEANAGDLYKVGADGVISGINVHASDSLICRQDDTPANSPNLWDLICVVDGRDVSGPTTPTVNDRVAVWDGTSAKYIKQADITYQNIVNVYDNKDAVARQYVKGITHVGHKVTILRGQLPKTVSLIGNELTGTGDFNETTGLLEITPKFHNIINLNGFSDGDWAVCGLGGNEHQRIYVKDSGTDTEGGFSYQRQSGTGEWKTIFSVLDNGTLTVETASFTTVNATTGNITNLNSDKVVVSTSITNNGTTTLNGPTNINSTLHVTGDTTLDSNLTVKKNIHGVGNLTIDGTTQLNNNLTVVGTTNLKGNVNIDKNLVVGGSSTLNGATTINNSLTTQNITVSTGHKITTEVIEVTKEIIAEKITVNQEIKAKTLNYTNNGVNFSITSNNAQYTHYTTSASTGHWFNKNVYVQGEIYAGSSYNKKVSHQGNTFYGTQATDSYTAEYIPLTIIGVAKNLSVAGHLHDRMRTARTLWGQSFNFTGNISGNISNTGNITPTTNNVSTVGTSALKYLGMYATTFYGALSGNATTATTLQTARTINVTVSGVAGTAQSFNGSANINIPVTLKTLTRGSYLTGGNYNGGTAQTWAVDATTANTANKVVVRGASGEFSMGALTTTQVTCSGIGTFAGGAFKRSDIRLKSNIKNISEEELLRVDRVLSVSFDIYGRHSYGVIAQELQKQFPELVITDEEGYLDVDYEAYHELKIKSLERKVMNLEDTIDMMRAQLDKITELLKNK